MMDDPIEHTSDDKKEENIKLSVQDIQINLRLLGDLKEDEKLMISENRFLMIDNRALKSIIRWLSEDSRIRTINFIDHLIELTKRYCESVVKLIEDSDQENDHYKTQHRENFEELLRFQGLLNSSITGLNRLAITYGNDKLSRAKLETIVAKIRTFCDMDLKKVIENGF